MGKILENTNLHRVYVKDPEGGEHSRNGLVQLNPGQRIELDDGDLARDVEATSGVYEVGTEDYVAAVRGRPRPPGPATFPVGGDGTPLAPDEPSRAASGPIPGADVSVAEAEQADKPVDEMSVKQLRALAKQRDVTVKGRGKDKRGRAKPPKRDDFIKALS